MAKVTVRPSGIEFTAEAGQTIMAAGQAAGYRWPTICGGVGDCHVCHVEVVECPEHLGAPTDLEQRAITALRGEHGGRGEHVRLACQAVVDGDVVVVKRGVRKPRPANPSPEVNTVGSAPMDPTSMQITADGVRLIGGRCTACDDSHFPAQNACPRCGGDTITTYPLADRGTLWSWTVQHYPPPSPPYRPHAGDFEPFGLGYVELADQVIVESVLTVADPAALRIGMPMRLTSVDLPGPDGPTAVFAFTPDEQEVCR